MNENKSVIRSERITKTYDSGEVQVEV